MDDREKLDLFLDVSAAITGFERIELVSTGMAYEYLETVEKNIGPKIDEELFFALYEMFRSGQEVVEERLRIDLFSNPKLGPILRAMIKLWYLGQWEPLAGTWVTTYGAPQQQGAIVSAKAYQEGLVWTAIDSHPMGAKQPGYGTWSSAPSKTNS